MGEGGGDGGGRGGLSREARDRAGPLPSGSGEEGPGRERYLVTLTAFQAAATAAYSALPEP